eukprot:gene11817-45_t
MPSEDSLPPLSSFTNRWVIAFVTFFAYVGFHSTRKSFSVIKPSLVPATKVCNPCKGDPSDIGAPSLLWQSGQNPESHLCTARPWLEAGGLAQIMNVTSDGCWYMVNGYTECGLPLPTPSLWYMAICLRRILNPTPLVLVGSAPTLEATAHVLSFFLRVLGTCDGPPNTQLGQLVMEAQHLAPALHRATAPCLCGCAVCRLRPLCHAHRTEVLGLMDTLFMMCYAFGLYASGLIADALPLRLVLTTGMLVSAVMTAAFGVLGRVGVHAAVPFLVVWALNGLVQSSGWPAVTAYMGNWFGKRKRGAVIGLWAGNASTGNIVGTALCVIALHLFGGPDDTREMGWQFCMVLTACFLALMGIIVFLFAAPTPMMLGLPDPNQEETDEDVHKASAHPHVHQKSTRSSGYGAINYDPDARWSDDEDEEAGFFRNLLTVMRATFPYLQLYSSSVHLAHYHAVHSVGMSTQNAAWFSMLFDAGEVFGGFLGGWLTDRMGARSPFIFVSTCASCAFIFMVKSTTSTGPLGAILFAAGAFMGGPANLIAGVVAADLGTLPTLKGNERLIATTAAIVDGTGSIGAAGFQILVGHLCKDLGNKKNVQTLFLSFVIGNGLCALLLLPVLWDESKVMYR